MVWQTSDSHRVRISPRSAARSYVSQQAPHLAPCTAHVCFQRRPLWHAAMQNIFCRLPAFHARRRTWRQPRAAHWCVCRCSHTLLHCAIPSPPHAHSSDSTCCLQPFLQIAGSYAIDSTRSPMDSSDDRTDIKRRKVSDGVPSPVSSPARTYNLLPKRHSHLFLCNTRRFPDDLPKDMIIIDTPWPIRHPTLGLQALLILHQHVRFHYKDGWGFHGGWTTLGLPWSSPIQEGFRDLLIPFGWASASSWGLSRHRPSHLPYATAWDLPSDYPLRINSELHITWVLGRRRHI